LTATPTINIDYDMWTLLCLCDPARFLSYWSYIFRFFNVSQSTFGLKIEGVNDSERYNLHKMISTYILTRDESILNLPDMSKRVIPYHLSPEHRAIYDQMENEWIASLGDESVSASVKVAQITRLRQLAISPKLLFSDYSGCDKIDTLVGILTDSKPTVVFTMFEQAAELVKERLNQNGISCETLTGKTKNRDNIIRRFGQGFHVLVATYGTGGESLTLTQAKRAIFLDYAWHPAGLKHAAKRIHRIGQSKEVEVIAIKSVDTIEEHIEDIIRTKGKMSVEELIRRMENGRYDIT
jgi:SNF2 family DNA or RNA helicase